MHAIEFEKMSCDRGNPVQLVDVRNIQPVCRPRIALRARQPPKSGTQRKPPNPAKAVDADAHGSACLGPAERRFGAAECVEPSLERGRAQTEEG